MMGVQPVPSGPGPPPPPPMTPFQSGSGRSSSLEGNVAGSNNGNASGNTSSSNGNASGNTSSSNGGGISNRATSTSAAGSKRSGSGGGGAGLRPSNCHVCGEDISDQNQTVHYGAVACFSCRAFFRRAQGLKRPFPPCKSGGNCTMTVDTRRFCGGCRYQSCLRAGMNPGSVLSEDQKRHRFRKMYRKRREGQAMKHGHGHSHGHGHGNSHGHGHCKRRRTDKSGGGGEEQMTPSPSSTCNSSSTSSSSEQQQHTPQSSSPPSAFGGASFGCPPDLSHLEKSFWELHSGHLVPRAFNRHLFGELYAHLTQQSIRSFAATMPEFRRLPFLERQLLVIQNGKAFAQFAVCCYLAVGSPQDGGAAQLSVFFPHLSQAASRSQLRAVNLDDIDKGVLRPELGEDNLLLQSYVKEVKKTLGVLTRDVEISWQDVRAEILFATLGGGPSRMIKTEGGGTASGGLLSMAKLVAGRMRELAGMGSVLASIHDAKADCLLDPNADSGFLARSGEPASKFWQSLAVRAQAATRAIIGTNEDFVDDVESLYQRRVQSVLALFMVRLSVAADSSEQQRILRTNIDGERSGNGGGGGIFQQLGRGAPSGKVQIFRLTSNKHLMRRALDDFGDLITRCSRCFISEDVFLLMAALSVFWDQDHHFPQGTVPRGPGLAVPSQPPSHPWQKKCLLSTLSCLVCNTSSVGQSLYEEICSCLDRMEALKYFCVTFASENVFGQFREGQEPGDREGGGGQRQ